MDGQTILLLAILGSLLLICVLVLAAFLIRRKVSATIAGFSWFRQVFLEHYVWVEESSYHGFPDRSRNQFSKRESYQSYEFARTETTTTTVNGQTTTTSRPVYEYVTRWRTKYTYEIQNWIDSRNLQAEGTERASVHWPGYTLDHHTQERVKKTKEKYLVFLQNPKGKQYKRELSEADWTALDDQAIYTLKVNFFGQVKLIIPNTQQLPEMPEQTVRGKDGKASSEPF